MHSSVTSQSLPFTVLERVARGESAALNDCISQYGGLVWSLARRLTRTAADAEDGTQEVFLSIWRSATVFDPAKGSEPSFVAMIARRRLIDRRRKCKWERIVDGSSDLEEAVNWSDPGTAPQTSLDVDAAVWALQQLKPVQRRMLELSLIQGYSQPEIAAQLNIPLGTVKSSLRRGLIRLRKYMQIEVQPVALKTRECPWRDVAHDLSVRMRSGVESLAESMIVKGETQ
jgi:RNA polymerase sigma-70 factor, ECF subfamily